MKISDFYSLTPARIEVGNDAIQKLFDLLQAQFLQYIEFAYGELFKEQTEVEIRWYVQATTDYGERVWYIGAVFFKNKPVLLFTEAGRSGRDHSVTKITDSNLYKEMYVWIQSKCIEEEVINTVDDSSELEDFYGMNINNFQMGVSHVWEMSPDLGKFIDSYSKDTELTDYKNRIKDTIEFYKASSDEEILKHLNMSIPKEDKQRLAFLRESMIKELSKNLQDLEVEGNFKEVKTNIDYLNKSIWSKYEGQSLGRVKHYLSVVFDIDSIKTFAILRNTGKKEVTGKFIVYDIKNKIMICHFNFDKGYPDLKFFDERRQTYFDVFISV